MNPGLSQAIKENLTMREVAEYYLGKPKNGSWVCPAHSDAHPSMTVKAGRWKCWSCNSGGDVFDFISAYAGVDFQGAIKMLARDFGVSDVEISAADRASLMEKRRAREIEAQRIRDAEAAERVLIETVCHKRAVLRALCGVRWRKWSEVLEIVRLQNEIDLLDWELDRMAEERR